MAGTVTRTAHYDQTPTPDDRSICPSIPTCWAGATPPDHSLAPHLCIESEEVFVELFDGDGSNSEAR